MIRDSFERKMAGCFEVGWIIAYCENNYKFFRENIRVIKRLDGELASQSRPEGGGRGANAGLAGGLRPDQILFFKKKRREIAAAGKEKLRSQ
jgi:hypothetical protein